MNRRLFAVPMFALLCCAGAASADTLLIERVQEEPGALPARGQTAAAVEARFGAPQESCRPGRPESPWP